MAHSLYFDEKRNEMNFIIDLDWKRHYEDEIFLFILFQ